MADDVERRLPQVVEPEEAVEPDDVLTDGDAPEPTVVDAPVAEEPESGAGLLVPTADTLQRYLSEIRRIPVLSREEEHELAVRWHEHEDRAAAIRLVTSNLRLVVLIAREYQRAVHNLLDLCRRATSGCWRRSRTSIPTAASASRPTPCGGCAPTSSATS